MIIAIIIISSYIILILSYRIGWNRLKVPHLDTNLPNISIIIALRNEEENIERLLGVKTVSSMNMFKKELNREHKALTTFLYDWVKERFDPSHTREILEWAAQTRGFLG